MKILALEFSTLHRSAALLDVPNSQFLILNSQSSITLLASHTEEAKRGGSPFPLIARVLNNDLPDALAIGLGPGSYTGIRSSLAIAQGYNLARNTQAAGISSADAIAYQAWTTGHRGPIEVIIDAQRNELYSACYNLTDTTFTQTHPLEILSAPRDHGQLLGPEATRYSSYAKQILPAATAIATLAANKTFTTPETLEPIYLRETAFVKAAQPR